MKCARVANRTFKKNLVSQSKGFPPMFKHSECGMVCLRKIKSLWLKPKV